MQRDNSTETTGSSMKAKQTFEETKIYKHGSAEELKEVRQPPPRRRFNKKLPGRKSYL